MKNKLLFLGCNHSQIPYLEELKTQNWNIIGVDRNSESPGADLCDRFYNAGYDDLSGLIAIGEKEKFTKEDRVFTAAAQFAHKGAAHFAKHFGIPYASEESVDLCLDKAAYYKYFQQSNIPIPRTWYIKNELELKDLVLSINEIGWYYLKSDHSKNPNYVYRFNAADIPYKSIFWGRNRYLREFYILQEEFAGVSLRLNVYAGRFNVIDFLSAELTYHHHHLLEKLGVLDTLRRFMGSVGLQDWLIKFDIILNDEKYVVLDVGMDPPFRMNKESQKQGINFAKYYINHYLFGDASYPLSLD